MAIGKLVVGDIVQMTIESDVLGQRCLNVLHYRARVGLPALEYQEAMDLLNQAVRGSTTSSIMEKMLPLMGENTKVVGFTSQRVYPTRDIPVRLPNSDEGTAPTVCNASNLAFVITKQSEAAGRGRNGSFHLAGVTDQHFALGNVTLDGQTALEELADRLRDKQVTEGGEFVFEPGLYKANSSLLENWKYLVGTTVQTTVRVLRRRTVGLGI